MLYDSGWVRAVVNKCIWKKIGKPFSTKTANLNTYGKKSVNTVGKLEVAVEAFENKLTLAIYVTEDEDVQLFRFGLVLSITNLSREWRNCCQKFS